MLFLAVYKYKQGTEKYWKKKARSKYKIPFGGCQELQLFNSNRFGQVTGAINIAIPEDGKMVTEKLHGDHGKDAL